MIAIVERDRWRSRSRSLFITPLSLLAALGCSTPESIPVSDVLPGVTLRGGQFVTHEDHLVELVAHEGHVYAANSNRGLAALRLEPDGGVTVTHVGQDPSERVRCTTVAVHASSDSLYCAADEPFDAATGSVLRFDLARAGQPVMRESFELLELSTRDLEVVGDRLLIHHFHGGLWTAAIDSSGALSQLADTGIVGNARVSVAVGGRIVTLLGDVEGAGAELRLLEPGDWSELDRISLSGPPLGLSADVSGAPRVAVGLGSGGMAVVEIASDELLVERTLEPPAVVTQGLLDGELAAAVTLSGVFAWSLPEAPEQAPRLFGFGPAAQLGHSRAGNMLHGLFVDGELLTSDWLHVERWALEPAGEVVELDVPRGVYVGPEGSIRWRVRNPGGIPLRAEFWADHEVVLAQRVEPGEVVELELSQAQRQQLLAPEDPSVTLLVRSYDVAVPSAGQPLSSSAIVLVQRDPSSMYPPATGEQFPTLTLADHELAQVFTFPPAGGGQTIWMWPDCALIWPQLEDLAWLARQGWELGRGQPIVLSEYDLGALEFAEQWGLAGVRFGIWGPLAPPEVSEANAALGEDIYAESFFISEMPGDAMPTDYVVDADGTIRSIERMYRGPWTLAVPWPW